MNKIIMLHGFPLSGKSTAAAKIKEHLARNGIPAEVISSARLRLKGREHSSTKGFIDERNSRTKAAKDRAYRKMCDAAGKLLQREIIPIMDATYHLLYRRKLVYDLAAEANADVYVVWMSFGSEKTIRELLKQRMAEKKVSKLHTWEQYETMARQTERLEDFELAQDGGSSKTTTATTAGIKVIRFDREHRTMLLYNCNDDEFAKGIAMAISGKSLP